MADRHIRTNAAIAAILVQASLQSRDDHELSKKLKLLDLIANRMGIEGEITGDVAVTLPRLQVTGAGMVTEPSESVDFDGELQSIIVLPMRGFALYQDALKAIGSNELPRVDCDVFMKLYIANSSVVTRYVRDLIVSVEVENSTKVVLKRVNHFRTEFGKEHFEYGWEAADDGSEWKPPPVPLEPLLSGTAIELKSGSPIEGWVRFLLSHVNPEYIQQNSWKVSIVDSLGKQHVVNKTAPTKLKGTIVLRRVS